MRKFVFILVALLLLLQTPIAANYVDGLYKRTTGIWRNLLDAEQNPTTQSNTSSPDSSSTPIPPRRTETPVEQRIFGYSGETLRSNYKGENTFMSGSQGGSQSGY